MRLIERVIFDLEMTSSFYGRLFWKINNVDNDDDERSEINK